MSASVSRCQGRIGQGVEASIDVEPARTFARRGFMSRRWRVGVVGTSWWADLEHLPGLRSRADVELASLCGRDRGRLDALARKYGVPRTFQDWEQMIDEGDLEVLVIATPNLLHHPMALRAIDAGLHVVCEKPLAMTRGEAREMAARARAARRETLTFFTHRTIAAATYAKRLLDEGLIGTPFQVNASYLKDSYLRGDRPFSWRMRRAEAGTGVLADLGSHLVDLVRYWVGDFIRVSGQWQTPMPERPGGVADADEVCTFLGELRSGAQALVQVSKLAAGRANHQRIELNARGGTLVFEADPGGQLGWEGRLLHGRPGRSELVPVAMPVELTAGLETADEAAGRAEAYRRLTDPFFAALSGEERGVHPTFDDGAAVQSVLDAVALSVERQTWVAVA
jgi:predicted dehydrogenase